MDKAYIVKVDNEYYVCKAVINENNIITLKEPLMIMVQAVDGKSNGVKLAFNQVLFGNNANSDDFKMKIVNPNNIVYYEAEKSLVSEYYSVIAKIKTNLVMVKDLPNDLKNNKNINRDNVLKFR